MKKSIQTILSILATALVFGACTSAKLATGELDALKSKQPAPGKALLYVVRPGIGAYAIRFSILCDKVKIGENGPKNFVYAELDPGTHQLVAEAENKDEIFLAMEAGKTYFLEQEVKMGLLYARTKWSKLTEAEGRKKLAKCKLSTDNLQGK